MSEVETGQPAEHPGFPGPSYYRAEVPISLEGVILLPSNLVRPGMLLHILRHTGVSSHEDR